MRLTYNDCHRPERFDMAAQVVRWASLLQLFGRTCDLCASKQVVSITDDSGEAPHPQPVYCDDCEQLNDETSEAWSSWLVRCPECQFCEPPHGVAIEPNIYSRPTEHAQACTLCGVRYVYGKWFTDGNGSLNAGGVNLVPPTRARYRSFPAGAALHYWCEPAPPAAVDVVPDVSI